MTNQDNFSNLFSHDIQNNKFNFQPFTVGSMTGYHVNVSDHEGSRHEFRMERTNNEDWVIEGENLPSWITQLNDDIIKAVKEHD